MTTNISNDVLKSALIELAQTDRAFLVSLFTDLINPKEGKNQKSSKKERTPNTKKLEIVASKIIPPYRQNAEEMRNKYAMDKNILLKLEDLFIDAPSAEEFLQIK
jgi:hypothetical protein